MPFHSVTTGVDSSSIDCCWRMMMSSRPFWWNSVVIKPRRSKAMVACQVSRATSSALDIELRISSKVGCFSENTNVAVSLGEKPARARETAMPFSHSCRRSQAGPCGRDGSLDSIASMNASRNCCDCLAMSASEIRSRRVAKLCSCWAVQSFSTPS